MKLTERHGYLWEMTVHTLEALKSYTCKCLKCSAARCHGTPYFSKVNSLVEWQSKHTGDDDN